VILPLNHILRGHVLDCLATLPDESVHCVVTSPPYWGLRDYGVAGQLGLEREVDCLGWATKQPCGECYICKMIAVFHEVRRVLRRDGTCWVNMGDSYAHNTKSIPPRPDHSGGAILKTRDQKTAQKGGHGQRVPANLKPKDLIGVPWRLALALQADGWWLRDDVIWHKPNPMPSSCTDRCTKAHEYFFLLSKSRRYYFDHVAIQEPAAAVNAHDATGQAPHTGSRPRKQHPTALSFSREVAEPDRPGQAAKQHRKQRTVRPCDDRGGGQGSGAMQYPAYTRNMRSVWTVATYPFPEAHFATFPPALIRPCIQAGTSEWGVCSACGKPWVRETETEEITQTQIAPAGWATYAGSHGAFHKGGREKGEAGRPVTTTTTGWSPSCSCEAGAPVPAVVLDPFMGSGTTALVASGLSRRWVGIELNEEYARMAERRLHEKVGLLAVVNS
jgi:DNA modification methylase